MNWLVTDEGKLRESIDMEKENKMVQSSQGWWLLIVISIFIKFGIYFPTN